MERSLGDAHPLFGEIEGFSYAPFALRTVPDRVLHLGAGMVGDLIPVVADMIQDLLVGTRKPGAQRGSVAQPAAKGVRGHGQFLLWIVERPTQVNRMVEPLPIAQRLGDPPGRDRLGVSRANAAPACGRADTFRKCLVDEMAGIR